MKYLTKSFNGHSDDTGVIFDINSRTSFMMLPQLGHVPSIEGSFFKFEKRSGDFC